MPRQLIAGSYFAFIGLLVAYLIASEWVAFWLNRDVEYSYVATNILDIQRRHPELFDHIWIMGLAFMIGGGAFGAHFASERLTKQGKSDWQTRFGMWRNKLLGPPGNGFVLAKLTKPELKGRYVTSALMPDRMANVLVIAPTGMGKGVGFVYPNLLSFDGSVVVLDVKGENFNTTARWRRHALGNEIYKFAPLEFGQHTDYFNPLQRLQKINNYPEVQNELGNVASNFLQAESANMVSWVNGATKLFTAIGGVAYERGELTLGKIYDIILEGQGDLQSHLADLAARASEPALQKQLRSLTLINPETLQSYLSILETAGFAPWANPHVAEVTSRSDFDFTDLRRKKMSVYFVIKDGDIAQKAAIIRLFFNELLATMQKRKPSKDEPHQVMIILDEFHLLGRMPNVVRAMTTIRGFGGKMAVITQTVPALDHIYSREERLSLQGNAGLKLYMTPSEQDTAEDLSEACGMTTKRIVSKSRKAGLDEETNFSERTEERPLLTPGEARQLPDDASIVIVNGQNPVKAKAIVHWKDRKFKAMLKEQAAMSWEGLGGPHDTGEAMQEGGVPAGEEAGIIAEDVPATSAPAAPASAGSEAPETLKTRTGLRALKSLAYDVQAIHHKVRDGKLCAVLAVPPDMPLDKMTDQQRNEIDCWQPIKIVIPESEKRLKRRTPNRKIASKKTMDLGEDPTDDPPTPPA